MAQIYLYKYTTNINPKNKTYYFRRKQAAVTSSLSYFLLFIQETNSSLPSSLFFTENSFSSYCPSSFPTSSFLCLHLLFLKSTYFICWLWVFFWWTEEEKKLETNERIDYMRKWIACMRKTRKVFNSNISKYKLIN
jgi:hypothetical protein